MLLRINSGLGRLFGVLYLITFVTSIPALLLYQPVLDDPVGYIAGGGHNNQVLFGVLLELLLIIANIGTTVVIFPVDRRQLQEHPEQNLVVVPAAGDVSDGVVEHRLVEQQRGDRRDERDEVEDAEKTRPLLIRKHP